MVALFSKRPGSFSINRPLPTQQNPKMSQTNKEEKQRLSAGFTLADLNFCYQYCAFVSSCSDLQPGEDQVRAFLRRSIVPTDVEYPTEWSTDDRLRDQAADRFRELTQHLQTPETEAASRSILNMTTFKRLAWFFAVGFAGNQLLSYLGANAAPTTDVARDVSSTSDVTMFHKGVHFDNVTQQDFHLFLLDDDLDEDAAFEQYLNAYVEEPGLTKRDWYDCRFPRANYIQKFCCNTGHALGTFVGNTGAAAMGGYLNSLLQESINGKRDNQKPRSVCLSRDGKNMCVSWASYSTDKATGAEDNDITNYSVQCAKSGGSAEFKTGTGDGGLLFICVSDRADGCNKNVG